MVDREYDVIIVGAGVAGGALATVLGRDGRRVLCVERSLAQPERIVGELLQPGGYEALSTLGLADALEGIDAQKVYGYGIFLDGKRMNIKYSSTEEKTFTGRSFHNGRFVARLRELAGNEPNVTLVEGNVKSLCEEDDVVVGIMYTDANRVDRKAFGKLTIACDGCFSRLRKMVNPAAEYAVMSQFYGLILKDIKLPYSDHGHVVLVDPSPLLFYPISSSEVRCLVDIPDFVSCEPGFNAQKHMLEHLLPQVPEEMRDAFARAVEEKDMKCMPNRAMPASPISQRGAILLGDSFNMRHPLTGGGMTVALTDVVHLRRLLSTVDDLADYSSIAARQEEFYAERRNLSATINILANALYSVFCASGDPVMKEMRDSCFQYLAKDGRMSEDPISMLGGLKPYPYLLVAHFFGVAFFACSRLLLPLPTPSTVAQCWRLCRSAFNIVKPLIDAEGVTILSKIPISQIR